MNNTNFLHWNIRSIVIYSSFKRKAYLNEKVKLELFFLMGYSTNQN